MPHPKSLDRNAFPAAMVDGLNVADGAATLTALTAAAVGEALERLPKRPTTVIVCGGGRKNPAIMNALRRRAGVTLLAAEDVGWRGDAIEAECFAYLAVRSLRGLPISFPLTTGVKWPMTGGRIANAPRA
jgi:anhydro-N-acetylmuramic acid kinase